MKRIIFVLLLTLGIISQGVSLWADDDAIMDVDNTQFIAIGGSWSVSSLLPCAIGGAYYYASGSNDSITVQTAQLADITGYYAVYARWSSASNRNNNALYAIYDGNTYRATKGIDQRSNGCNWQYLATVYLTAGNRGKVVLYNSGATASEVTVADGIRFVRVTKDGGDIASSSLYDYNIGDEPGIEFDNDGTPGGLTNAFQTRGSLVVTAPTSGYIYVIATGDVECNTANTYAEIRLRNVTTAITLADVDIERGTALGEQSFAVSGVFSVGSGSDNIVLEARCSSGTGSIEVVGFTAMFFPTKY